ncbi:cupin domain-containing protein [uncultured Psychrobacter sp.]|uniref:cupin domain-containing protein n=1 Tax=uncultured Psychrobacter sp. TaxID=259303 RepID=UPI003457C926
MLINADFTLPAALAPHKYQWTPSPQKGVERVMLDRVGAEKARATSLVRYAPNSYFPRHEHPGGEEILVLSGTFSADDQHYPAGWYLRNPPTSKHMPFSEDGAVIFVKLWQMPSDETRQVFINTNDDDNWHKKDGREICPLFAADYEHVSLQRLRADEALFAETIKGGAELLVLEGELINEDQTYQRGGWIRLPVGGQTQIRAGKKGVIIYLKLGHLLNVIGINNQ